ncbi:uncharacterized protein LOC133523279 isoform X3 [Cydia pomonella]|uniref:uncharacterized protein LOC133523279 isoform X3 n=1 Tax=Cydia pomonella TaxID=82600 RepID=UPI002ADE45B2|nr:uncharacterized protein LOC133523279 isoform X3 [Cydia pomonella]XP_061714761.1 uncharacterized protein LOC133523279 isoform X3 [Cydia pomonella]
MNTNTELPQVHTSVHLPSTRRTCRDSRRYMTSDLPPSYNSLYAPTNTVEEAVPRCESEDEAGFLAYEYCFEDKTTRIGFIQKVLGLKLLQMLFMTAIIAGFWANTVDIIRFMYRGNHLRDLMLVSNVVFILVYGMMVACGRIRRRSPYRYLFLVVLPLSLFSCSVSTTVSYYLPCCYTVSSHCKLNYSLIPNTAS